MLACTHTPLGSPYPTPPAAFLMTSLLGWVCYHGNHFQTSPKLVCLGWPVWQSYCHPQTQSLSHGDDAHFVECFDVREAFEDLKQQQQSSHQLHMTVCMCGHCVVCVKGRKCVCVCVCVREREREREREKKLTCHRR